MELGLAETSRVETAGRIGDRLQLSLEGDVLLHCSVSRGIVCLEGDVDETADRQRAIASPCEEV